MNNYLRALRLALRYRSTVFVIIISSVLVGVLWGANITAVYPFVQVVLRKQSMHDWVDQKIEKARVNSARLQASLRDLQSPDGQSSELEPQSSNHEIQFQQALLKEDLKAQQKALGRYLWMEPYIKAWLPDDAFQTLLVIVGFLVVGTALKDTFLVINMIVVERLVQMTTFDLRKQFF
ncbi:MAG: hypothetical protein QGF59_30710, partial [Pirellulaceae bacterium]|nr:hypothetical protein [Pirellulaceae bacterium]